MRCVLQSVRRLGSALSTAIALLGAALLFAAPAQARLDITIDKSAQRMSVSIDGAPMFDWPVSTGVSGHDTPSGSFKAFRMERHHFSREWDDAPMPHSIFFTQRGHAIHGTTHLKAIGRPASHGCVRLEPGNAATLFDLVKQEGMANTRVTLIGDAPNPAPAVASTPSRSQPHADAEDENFTNALPPRRSRDGWRDYSSGPAFYDGRYYYDRRGRRYSGPVYRERPRYYRYDRGDPFWWGGR